ncbi:MAG: hypothetical protein V3T77_08620, partial [Planctomycetota bacterium]
MITRRFLSVVLLALFASAATLPLAAQTVLDGKKKSIVVVGYSTSYAWPEMLQDMLDEHSAGERRYHVLNAVVGGSPVETWIAARGTPEYEATVGAMVRDFLAPGARLRGQAPRPTVAICQQSLQFTRTLRGPIADTNDKEGIRIGADAFEKLALRLRELGLKRIFMGSHIYKVTVEPEVGNERLALAAFLERGHDFMAAGPDTWALTRASYPEAFTADKVHPNEQGMKIMAESWYRTLAGDGARQDIIDRM